MKRITRLPILRRNDMIVIGEFIGSMDQNDQLARAVCIRASLHTSFSMLEAPEQFNGEPKLYF